MKYFIISIDGNFFFGQLFSIFVIFSFALFLAFSPTENVDELTSIDFYESFFVPKQCFKLYHKNPSSPLFLVIDVQYELFKKAQDNFPKRVRRKYELKQVKEPCKGSLAIKTYGNEFIEMELKINISLYYGDAATASFIYQFKNDFNFFKYIVVDTKNNFGVEVNFLDFADDQSIDYNRSSKEVKTYLRSLRRNNGFICVITKNDHPILIRPKQLSKNVGLITRFKMQYIKNGTVIYTEDYRAFECFTDNYTLFQTVLVIFEGYDFELQPSVVHWIFNENNETLRHLKTKFLNIFAWEMLNRKPFPKNSNILFFLKMRKAYLVCPNNDKVTLLISQLNYFYYVMINKFVEISQGIKRMKQISHSLTSPCGE